MAKRTEILIKSATVVNWAWGGYSTVGNSFFKFTIVDDATGVSYTGKTRNNTDFTAYIGREPKALKKVRLVGKVMTTAEKG